MECLMKDTDIGSHTVTYEIRCQFIQSKIFCISLEAFFHSLNAIYIGRCLFYWYLCLLNLMLRRTLSTEFIAYRCHQWLKRNQKKTRFERHSSQKRVRKNSRSVYILTVLDASFLPKRRKKIFLSILMAHIISPQANGAHIQFHYVNMFDKREKNLIKLLWFFGSVSVNWLKRCRWENTEQHSKSKVNCILHIV